MQIDFGTDGWRGILDQEFNRDNILIIAQAFADYLNSKAEYPKAAVGFDGRKYSMEFGRLFSEVLSANGISVYLSHDISPTPVVSYFVKHENLNAGVMITASHNPADYNGVKFKANYGGPFLTEETNQVSELTANVDPRSVKFDESNIEVVDFTVPYKKQLESIIDFAAIREKNLNILIDSMSGAGQTMLEEILKSHDCRADTIYGAAKADFSGRYAEPIEKNLAPLKETLIKNDNYALGAATDGDADRVGILLENGDWLSAQETIMVLTDFIVNSKNFEGYIVKTASVTNLLKRHFENEKRAVENVQVGFKYICEKMLKQKTAIGVEESGGYGYGVHMPERDGILSALLIVEMLAKSDYDKLSEYVEAKSKIFGNIYYDRIDHKYNKNDRVKILSRLVENAPMLIGNFKLEDLQTFKSSKGFFNGVKFILKGNSRWLLIRVSETEPLVRIYAEGENNDEVKQLLSKGLEYFSND
jgi:phosphomannomutase